jgi:hypothetical protein
MYVVGIWIKRMLSMLILLPPELHLLVLPSARNVSRTMIYDIPDPFQTFVAKKYAKIKGMQYDFFAKEWYLKTACCGEELYAPNKKTMVKIRLYHTRNECTGWILMI